MCVKDCVKLICLLVGIVAEGCTLQRKITALETGNVKAEVAIIQEFSSGGHAPGRKALAGLAERGGDTVCENARTVDLRGDRIIMNAVRDEESGEMVAADVLNSIVVEAPFRNIAERNGEVEAAFEIKVPVRMQDENWQVRFLPAFCMQGDTLYADQVFITGAGYRRGQINGYERYRKFLRSIIPDSCDFISAFCYERLLDIFIARRFKGSPDWERDTMLRKEVIAYYTRHRLVSLNEKRKSMRGSMFRKYVNSPILTGGVRLDSVITCADGSLRYRYVQTIRAVKGLRKIEVILSGGIYSLEKCIYEMPPAAPLTFYVSSISTFADGTLKYIKTIKERDLHINTAAYIDFETGKHAINDTLYDNERETGRLKENLRRIFSEDNYIVDSLVITASCSPEGSWADNAVLARNRAISLKDYFAGYAAAYRDSLKKSRREMERSPEEEKNLPVPDICRKEELDIHVRSIPEEWSRLEKLIRSDTCITDKKYLLQCFATADPDLREKEIRKSRDYKYIRSVLYPYLRTVKFDFFLHRRGMLKDTVHTTGVDTVYMAGVSALQQRDYKRALAILQPYHDFNTAVACVCLDYNQSALAVLETLPRSARRDYMLAVVYCRLGREPCALEYYLHACEQDAAMWFRGNLDPEISGLIRKYGLHEKGADRITD